MTTAITILVSATIGFLIGVWAGAWLFNYILDQAELIYGDDQND